MRRDLHHDRSVPALYIAAPGAQPVACTVRTHDRIEAQGALPASSMNGFAQIQESVPKLIFIADDAPDPIRRGATVSVEAGEAYRIDHVEPPHDITVTAKVTKLTAGEAMGLPLPVDVVPMAAPVGAQPVELLRDLTGHGVYGHTGGPQTIAANVTTVVANNRGTEDETQKPSDIATFYDGERITGRAGDGLGGTLLFTFTPSDGTASWLTVYLRGTNGRVIFPMTVQLPGGSGFTHRLTHTFSAYNRATWAQSGVEVVVECDGAGVLNEVQYVLHRLHKALPA